MTNLAAIQELLKKKKAALKGAGKTIKPKQGKNNYVILAPWRGGGDGQFWHDFAVHFVKDAADQLQSAYVCVNETLGKPCAICDSLAAAQATVGAANPEVAELLKKAKAGTSYLVNVLALDSDTPDVPQVLALGKSAFDNLLTVMEEWGDQISDAASPQVVCIERTGTTMTDTRYTVQATSKRHTYKTKVEPIDLDKFVAQESEEGERKALYALRNITKAGPVTTRLPGKPSGDAPQLANAAKAGVPTGVLDDDIPDSVTMAPATAAAAPAAAPISHTADIDAMLAELEAGEPA